MKYAIIPLIAIIAIVLLAIRIKNGNKPVFETVNIDGYLINLDNNKQNVQSGTDRYKSMAGVSYGRPSIRFGTFNTIIGKSDTLDSRRRSKYGIQNKVDTTAIYYNTRIGHYNTEYIGTRYRYRNCPGHTSYPSNANVHSVGYHSGYCLQPDKD